MGESAREAGRRRRQLVSQAGAVRVLASSGKPIKKPSSKRSLYSLIGLAAFVVLVPRVLPVVADVFSDSVSGPSACTAKAADGGNAAAKSLAQTEQRGSRPPAQDDC